METLFQFFDEVDDFIIATVFRLQRLLSPSPQERRQVPKTHLTLPSSQHPLLAESGHSEFDCRKFSLNGRFPPGSGH